MVSMWVRAGFMVRPSCPLVGHRRSIRWSFNFKRSLYLQGCISSYDGTLENAAQRIHKSPQPLGIRMPFLHSITAIVYVVIPQRSKVACVMAILRRFMFIGPFLRFRHNKVRTPYVLYVCLTHPPYCAHSTVGIRLRFD